MDAGYIWIRMPTQQTLRSRRSLCILCVENIAGRQEMVVGGRPLPPSQGFGGPGGYAGQTPAQKAASAQGPAAQPEREGCSVDRDQVADNLPGLVDPGRTRGAGCRVVVLVGFQALQVAPGVAQFSLQDRKAFPDVLQGHPNPLCEIIGGQHFPTPDA